MKIRLKHRDQWELHLIPETNAEKLDLEDLSLELTNQKVAYCSSGTDEGIDRLSIFLIK